MPERPKLKYKPIRKPKPAKLTPEEKAGRLIARLEAKHGLTPARVTQMILRERGLLLQVCRSLNIPRSTLQRYIEKHEECIDALIQAREAQGDKAEKKLFELIDAGDVRCIIYYLSTVHRARGYGTTSSRFGGGDDPGTGNGPVIIETVNIVGVPSGTFLPKEADDKVIEHAG